MGIFPFNPTPKKPVTFAHRKTLYVGFAVFLLLKSWLDGG